MYFSNSDKYQSFLWTFALSYCNCFYKTFWSTLYHESPYLKTHYQHSISNTIVIAKILFFFLQLKKKNRKTISNTPHYSFFCLVILHQYHFDTITYFSANSDSSIHKHPFRFQTKGCLDFQKKTSISVCQKSWNHLENFLKLPRKTSMLETCLCTLGSFSKSFSEQLFCREPVHTCFCKKVCHST